MSPANPSGTNTLALATSPYLRQHADNPVHWQQWTPQALAEAAARAVPILLSVGYAACHWCHVMAHESFDDDEVAAAMNAGFVCIKVDREERPDIDAVYMNATVALTGQGGWPMTCFLTPNGRPFFCGTYYPKAAFLQLLSAISETWRERRAEVEQASDHIAAELRSMASGLPGGGPEVAPELCDDAVAGVLREQDTAHGGFGGAPKFPPSALLEALMRHYERTRSPAALEAVARTGNAMARGGIYDQLGGGFARYSVDGAWVVPHFEKMLYDNALLLRAYAHWARRTGDPLARRVAAQTARFLLDELGSKAPADMFTSSLDADADGREGSTYVWTPVQLTEVLGGDDGRWAAEVFGVTEAGTFEHGTSVLQLPADPDDAARLDRVRAALLVARLARAQPARDDKVVTSWNGLAITALAEASVALDDPALAHAARRCATRLLDLHVVDGRLRRASLGGVVGDSAAILEDHAMLATGLLALYQLTSEGAWLTAATGLLDTAVAHFGDPQRPGRWFDTADDAERLMLRPSDPLDGATPWRFVDRRGAADGGPCGRRCSRRAVLAAGGRHAAGACGAAGSGAAVGRALAGGRRGGGARTAADRRRVRPAAVVPAGRRAPAGPGRGDRRGRRGGFVGAAGRPGSGGRRRRRLRMPGPGLRSAGDQRGRTRHRFGRTRLADSGGTRPP
ncbi:membrane protein [Mycobacterium tuberculosis]|nr:membrane protein [Mycobacterium tuberculosis]